MNYINEIINLKKLSKQKKLDADMIFNFVRLDKKFNDIEQLHLFLISKINKLHKKEISSKNLKICKISENAPDCLDKCEDAKIGNKIYFLNNSLAINYVFGDIHSDSITVMEFLRKIDFIRALQSNENVRLIFLGDYVDRGKAEFKALEIIFILKYIFPNNVFILKGNHDGGTIISEDEYMLCVGRNDNTTDNDYFVASLFNTLKDLSKPLTLLEKYLEFFNNLCHAALIKNGGDTVLCVHGGIPRPKNDMYEHLHYINDFCSEDIIDDFDANIISNMVWSDPTEDTTLQRNTRRFYFYKSHFDAFTSRFSISKIIRGHQAFEKGYREFFDKKLMSIFTSGKCGSENPETAYPNLLPCVLKLENGMYEIIRLK